MAQYKVYGKRMPALCNAAILHETARRAFRAARGQLRSSRCRRAARAAIYHPAYEWVDADAADERHRYPGVQREDLASWLVSSQMRSALLSWCRRAGCHRKDLARAQSIMY